MNELSIAVIGCGVIGRCHMAAVQKQPGVTLAAVADIQEKAAKEAATSFGASRWATDPLELIRDPEIDAVILALPTVSRQSLTREAVASGKHVLLEKPAAMNAAELAPLPALVRPGQVIASASARFRAIPAGRAAADILAQNPIGKIHLIQVRAIVPASKPPEKAPPAWRLNRSLNGGGILVNWGIYDLDYLLGTLGWSLRPQEVQAVTWGVPPLLATWVAEGSDAEAHVKALVRFDNGTLLDYERAELFGGKAEALWRLVGEKGSVEIPMLGGAQAAIKAWQLSPEGVAEQSLWRQQGENPDLAEKVLEDFVEAIREGRPALTDLSQTILLTRLTDGIYRSACSGNPEKI